MSVFQISYLDAVNGKYRMNRYSRDSFADYFDGMHAETEKRYLDPDVKLDSNHLQNVTNLIYAGRKLGIDRVELALDDEKAQKEIVASFYVIALLPEVAANFDLTKIPPLLTVDFTIGRNTGNDMEAWTDIVIEQVLDAVGTVREKSVDLPQFIRERYELAEPGESQNLKDIIPPAVLDGLEKIFGKK